MTVIMPTHQLFFVDMSQLFHFVYNLMTFFEFTIIQIVLLLGVSLIVLGWVGAVTGNAFAHQAPLGPLRPTLYALVAYLLVLDSVESMFGPSAAHALFYALAAAVIYELTRPFMAPTVQVTGATPEAIDTDLRDAFDRLGLQYAGTFPHYILKNPRTRLRVKYWKRLGQAQISVYPRSRRPLLLRIEAILEKDFSHEELPTAHRAFKANLIEGTLLIGLAAWRIGVHFAS